MADTSGVKRREFQFKAEFTYGDKALDFDGDVEYEFYQTTNNRYQRELPSLKVELPMDASYYQKREAFLHSLECFKNGVLEQMGKDAQKEFGAIAAGQEEVVPSEY